jgi:hypothetical protein
MYPLRSFRVIEKIKNFVLLLCRWQLIFAAHFAPCFNQEPLQQYRLSLAIKFHTYQENTRNLLRVFPAWFLDPSNDFLVVARVEAAALV